MTSANRIKIIIVSIIIIVVVSIYKTPIQRSFDIDNSVDFLIVKKFINAK